MIKDRITAAVCYYSKLVNANATSWSLHNCFIQSQKYFTCKCGPEATGATSVVEVDLFDSCLSNKAGAKIHSRTGKVQCR